MKKIIALFVGMLLAVPPAQAQTETGTSVGAQAFDRARSAPISAGRTTAETVTVTDYKTTSGKEVTVVEEEDKWWSVNVSTGWDSLYMYRGVNILGNGNSLYWLGGDVSLSPWANGTFTPSIWYGMSMFRWATTPKTKYGELDIGLDYTHTFGALAMSVGWIMYYYPDFGVGATQNEIYLGGAYDIQVGSVTLTPNATYYLNVGPNSNMTMGYANYGSSYLQLQLDASIPVYEEVLALEPWAGLGFNFGVNGRWDPNNANGDGYEFFGGGNNYEMGVAMPFQVTDWFNVSPYVAMSYTWQHLGGAFQTDPVTWWCGISANFSY